MNLYRVLTGHIAPKESLMAISHYVLAENDADVYTQIYDMFYLPKNVEEYLDDKLNSDEVEERDELKQEIKEQDLSDEYGHYTPAKIIHMKGNTQDDSQYEDAYYGCTVVRWELVEKSILLCDIEHLERLGIFEDLEKVKSRLASIDHE